MKCANCKDNHASIAEVKNCFQTGDTSQCIHQMAAGTCILCKWKGGSRGVMRSIRADRPSFCWLCKDTIEVTDRILTHWLVRGWCHAACFYNRDLLQQPATLFWMDQDALGDIEFHEWWSRPARLSEQADELFAEAIGVERETTLELLQVVMEDMGKEPMLSHLIAETFFDDELTFTDVFSTELGLDGEPARAGVGSDDE